VCWDIVISGLGVRHIYFRYNATSNEIVDNTIEQLDLENMGVAVGILLLCTLERDMMWATNDNKGLACFRFLRRHIRIAFCSPNIFRKSHESALIDLWRFHSYGDESGPGDNLPPMSNTRIKQFVTSDLLVIFGIKRSGSKLDLLRLKLS